MSLEIVSNTWTELGLKVRPLSRTVMVRTEKIRLASDGGILFPSSESSFYSGPMHLRLVTGIVLALGPKASSIEPGERICFQRQYLRRWKVLEDGSFVGWLDANEVTGVLGPTVSISKFVENPLGPKQPMYHPL